MKNGQSVVMVVLNSVSFYSPQSMEKITADENLYNKEPLLFEQKGNWTLIKFTKLYNNEEN